MLHRPHLQLGSKFRAWHAFGWWWLVVSGGAESSGWSGAKDGGIPCCMWPSQWGWAGERRGEVGRGGGSHHHHHHMATPGPQFSHLPHHQFTHAADPEIVSMRRRP